MSWLKLARRTGGVVLCTVGVFSLALPIIPGWLLIVVGLYLLSVDSPGLKRRFGLLCARYPLLDRIRQKGHRLFGSADDHDEHNNK